MEPSIFEDWYLLFSGLFFVSWLVSFLAFTIFSGRYLEKMMAKEQQSIPSWDSGVGMRYGMYAMVLVFNKAAVRSPIDDAAVLKYARPIDRFLAIWTMDSFIFFLVLAFLD
ncbi:hypothetical protein FLM48_04895 [Shewanella sp. Scap07]|uniref:hypothetical protein n=1 Tax=Shewanella sp. Scap07 TaxID=2589987 RepID=UPI0015BB6432|nr:hypothetical protein [Shewanella sp. Scap07]QLE84484.1 hypothetical protein FLM48_04895 [Shewanella sp. Scap07]